MPIVFILFIIIPIIEITVLINVGSLIGVWYTVGLVLLSAFIGVNMLRYQGLSTLARAQQKMQQGELPGQEMMEGIVLAVGGALLITPGFVTDFIGFCCLLPFTRIGLIKLVKSRFKVASMNHSGFQAGGFHSQQFDPRQGPFAERKTGAGDVFEGEFSHSDGAENKPSSGSLDKLPPKQ